MQAVVSRLGGIPWVLSAVLIAALAPARAGTVALAWDPVQHRDPRGYKVYYGPASGEYTHQIDVGRETECTISGLSNCTVWYFAVKSYDSSHHESMVFSNEVAGWPRPEVLSVTPAAAEQGERLDVIVRGTNFRDPAMVAFSNLGIIVNSVTVTSCTELVANVTIARNSPIGGVNVTVTSPSRIGDRFLARSGAARKGQRRYYPRGHRPVNRLRTTWLPVFGVGEGLFAVNPVTSPGITTVK